jgi:hypothetical protein
VGFGVLSAGAQMGATLAMAYSLDCHKAASPFIVILVGRIPDDVIAFC